MSLKILLKIGRLEAHETNREQVPGDDVDESSVDECIEAADNLLRHMVQWLASNKPG